MKYANLITLKEHKGALYSLCKGEKAYELYSGGSDRHVILWNLKTLKAEKVVAKSPSPITALFYLDSLQILCIGQMEGGVHVIDLKESKEARYLKLHKGYIFDIQFIKKKNELIFSSGDGTISIWSVPDFKLLYQQKVAEGKCRKMAFKKDANELAVSTGDASVVIFDTEDWSEKFKLDSFTSAINKVAYHPGKDVLLVGEKDAHLYEVDRKSNQITRDLAAHYWAIYDLDFSANGEYFATASRDKTIKIWDAEKLEVLQRIEGLKDLGHTHSVNALLWLSYKDYIVSAGDDMSLKVWEKRSDQKSS